MTKIRPKGANLIKERQQGQTNIFAHVGFKVNKHYKTLIFQGSYPSSHQKNHMSEIIYVKRGLPNVELLKYSNYSGNQNTVVSSQNKK